MAFLQTLIETGMYERVDRRSEETDCTHTTSDIINHPREVWCRYTLNDIEPWKKIQLFKRGVKYIAQPQKKYQALLR